MKTDRAAEIQSALFKELEEQEKNLWKQAERCQESLNNIETQYENAKRELPIMREKEKQKRLALQKLTREIEFLENNIQLAEQSIADRLNPSLSIYTMAKRNFERAKYEAESFVSKKLKELTE